ncbi:putative chitinase [Dyella sp. OK004]|uniref:XVIPCD domain-containing protein n=1 Tax=Dyella sp. OK004 TaxID=1855292 RepID=UPI0008ED9D94|nr:XVIPCD domain-containing protein [Dyella sp. OK004]SFR90196.1 putative chitinase [Dyella sp. OK004]
MAMDREAQVLNDAVAAGITSPRELANFMAQVTHESNGLNRLDESFRYTKSVNQIPVESAWRQGEAALESARKEALQGKPEHLAELMYGGRNGNDEPGDGYKYHGRGYIQLTGKDNYRAAGEALQLDLVKHPELAAQPENAAKIAVWYWENRVPEKAHEDVRAATRAVNGKLNGLADRETRFAEWEKKLTPEVMERLTKGQVGLPHAPSAPVPSKSEHHATGASLREKDQGPAIRELQDQLHTLGYGGKQPPLKADGHFGPNTKHAVEDFQRAHGLTPDGVAGKQTMAKIHELAQASKPQLNDSRHPDHELYKQALDGVHKLDTQHGRAPDTRSEQLAAALVVAAREHGLSRIDHVVPGQDASHIYAAQGALNSPFKQVAGVPTTQALDTPIAQSSQMWEQAAKQQQTTQPQQSQQTQAQAQTHGM